MKSLFLYSNVLDVHNILWRKLVVCTKSVQTVQSENVYSGHLYNEHTVHLQTHREETNGAETLNPGKIQ